MDPNSVLLSPQSRTFSCLTEPSMEGGRSPAPPELARDSLFSWSQLPSSGLADPDWFWDEHIQAKRARVETIVQGMCLSPSPLGSGSARSRNSPCCPEKAQKRKRKQSLPMQQGPQKPSPARDQGNRKGLGTPYMREQLHLLKQQLRHLQEHVLQAAEPRGPAQGPGDSDKGKGPLRVKQRSGGGSSPWTVDSALHQGSNRDLSRVDRHRMSEAPGFLPSGADLREILREELTRAMSQTVDSVLQKVLLEPPGHLVQAGRSFQGLAPEDRSEPSPSEGGAYKEPHSLAILPRRAQPQTGVPMGHLSLAKPLDSPRYPDSPRMIPKSYQDLPTNCPLAVPSCIPENQILSQLLGHGSNGHWSDSPLQDSASPSHPSSESVLRPWGAIRLRRPSTLSQQQYSGPFTAAHLVKMEQVGLQAVTEALPFSSAHIQEGLNPGHLKKAKLMFFFTRYPSSNLLKVYFPDVQFNRCITSQMIKWFSNFREFYYIQMEKFARQAISEGVTNPKMLVVLRDSELFRALNTHYNKGNDFQVPDCFLEIASLTLQEFFRAVSAGKDSDPSWKKPIYKIISKLDSDIPEIFKSSSYPQELFQVKNPQVDCMLDHVMLPPAISNRPPSQ
ncbi:PREDICTED: prospero homeobox protein 2 [Chrysochloris asiatica]|uniref:Prospero homeobox protein 2 n=1 Tax=Chrysochloris asiatica TaxID=185453 RepID=A0A9B0WSI8_CHRAS|nr:PREDICTED: prospero homeobox protein 2 [Chrysochloris asiatica]